MADADPHITQRLAEFVVAMTIDGLPSEVVVQAKRAIADTVGTALAGSVEPSTRMLRAAVLGDEPEGPAAVLGTRMSAAGPSAAMANGYAAHVLDYDDSQQRAATHLSSVVVPAVLAVGEPTHASGAQLVAAYVAGMELGCRLARAGGFSRQLAQRKIHPTSYLGHFAAAAAAGRLIGLDVAQMRSALGIAAGFASGTTLSLGTMAKAIGPGNAARNGVTAALLAADDFEGPDSSLDADDGVLAPFDGGPDAVALFDGLGEEFEVCHNTQKMYACAGWRNPIVDAAMALSADHGLAPDDVARADVWAWHGLEGRRNYPQPTTGLQSKFSAQHAFAVGMVDHAGGIAQFSDHRAIDPTLAQLRGKVTLGFDDTLEPFQIRVDVTTIAGDALSHFIPVQKGNHANPATWDELTTKLRSNAAAVLDQDAIDGLVATFTVVDTLDDVAEIARLCRPAE